jgi:hypothetical protein
LVHCLKIVAIAWHLQAPPMLRRRNISITDDGNVTRLVTPAC